MIELHGWVTIREMYEAVFEEENRIDLLVDKIRKAIDRLSWFKPEIHAQNGEYFINFSYFSNRMNPQTQEIFDLFGTIGEIAKGSYGLIYLYNDEDSNGRENEFQVFSLNRGIVKEGADPFLSPIIPTLEDKDIVEFKTEIWESEVE